jgi:hypothetical protein
MKKLETMTAYISLLSEVIYLRIAVVVLGMLTNFSKNFKMLLDLAAGL